MVRFVKVGPIWDNRLLDQETRQILESSDRRFHLWPGHPSFDQLRQAGLPCEPLPSHGIEEGTVVVPSHPTALDELVHLADRLLGPGGCPWDQEQTHESLKRHLLEEAYEVLDAIDSGSKEKLKEELGDLLLQPIMHAEMEKLEGSYDIQDVASILIEKLVRRHPHVFGELPVQDAEEVLKNWDRIKRSETGQASASLLAGVPQGMASLLRAFEISKRAARAGFEWPDREAVFEKLKEEELELKEAIQAGDPQLIESEIGDLLFTAVNIARWSNVEPEEALRKMLNRFIERFTHMEQRAERPLEQLSPEEWDELWEASKAEKG